MTFETFLDGLNKGGFAFLGMILIAALFVGGVRLANWLFTKGWPDLMQALGQSGADYKEAANTHAATARDAMAQTQQVITRQSTMMDTMMDGHKIITGRLDTVVTKADAILNKLEELK